MERKHLYTKIFKIHSESTEQMYIGATVDNLQSRLYKYRYSSKHLSNTQLKRLHPAFYVIKNADAKIDLIKEVQCDTKRELERQIKDAVDEETKNCGTKPKALQKEPAVRKESYYKRNRANILQNRRITYRKNKHDRIERQKKELKIRLKKVRLNFYSLNEV